MMIDNLRKLLIDEDPSIAPDLDNYTYIKKLTDNLHTLFYKRGMLKSITKQRPIDADENYIPWYTYPAIDYLNQIDFSECSIIEFGSGYSTPYWSRMAKHVTSIERNSDWYDEVANIVSNMHNVHIKALPDTEQYFKYIHAIDNYKYDVIIIDGADRHQTAAHMHSKLTAGGLIILDNSDWYPGTCNLLRNKGFTQIDFAGFGPINNYTWCTSIFFTSNISMPHKNGISFPGGRTVVKDDDR